MRFHRFICILYVLCESETGATAGHIASRAGAYGCKLSKGQVETCLKQLVSDGYVVKEIVRYRPNMDKNVYYIDPATVEGFRAIVQTYAATMKKMLLPVQVQ